MSTTEVDAPSPRPTTPGARGGIRRSPASAVRRGLRDFADRWPFQRKLNILVGVPLAVIALLLSYLIDDLLDEAKTAGSASRLVRDSSQVAQLVADLQAEHQQAVLLSVRHEAVIGGGRPSTSSYRVAQRAVDRQVDQVREAFGDSLPDTEAQALREIEGLAGLRDTIEQGYLPADNIDPAYAGAAGGLIDGLGLDRNASLASTFTGNLLDSLLRADAAHGAFETGVFSARTGDSNALIEFTGAVGSYELFTYQAHRFSGFATEAQTDELGDIEHNAAQAVIGQHYAELAVDPSALQAESRYEIRTAFQAALESYPHYERQAESRLKITSSLIDQIADRADSAASSAVWRAGLLLTLALLGFAGWIGLSVLVRRSVIRPVRALTGAAQEVADVAGRELARVADDDAEEIGPPRLRELRVTAEDEIGALAEAFNNVQTTAAALLERQVLSRRNTAEMFGNVGRRVSNLTARQLALIDAVERGETDPALLERLYSIDHIAVRLRRNADSLMLLAGIRETVLDSGPTALTNVVRAALGQIEGFRRVVLHAGPEVMVEPDIIGDLTLMIAELLENAVSFSPEGSPVEVRVSSDDDGATITVADHGLGMSTERLAEENSRLVRRERLDLVPTKVLGLFVVGALARRWDIDVTLTRTPGGGVTAEIDIPSALLLILSHAGLHDTPAPAATPPALPATASETAAADPTSARSATPGTATPGTAAAAPADSAAGAPSSPANPGPDPRPAFGSPQDPAAASPTAAPASPAADSPGTPDSPAGEAAPTARASGPTRAASVPAWAAADGEEPAPLPRRLPRREATPAGQAPKVPGPRSGEPAVHTRAADGEDGTHAEAPAPGTGTEGPAAHAGTTEPRPRPEAEAAPERPGPTPPADSPAPDGSRPLRRRVRGATLRSAAEADALQSARRAAARPADADSVRSELEEFEAAVERAHRDTGEHPRPLLEPSDGRPESGSGGRNTAHDQNHLPEGAEQ